MTFFFLEFVINNSLDSKSGASDFYYSASGFLALLYSLGGADFHQENLIACGAPVLVDLETILRQSVRPFFYEEFSDEDREKYR